MSCLVHVLFTCRQLTDSPKIPTTFLVAYMVDKFGRKIPLVSLLYAS